MENFTDFLNSEALKRYKDKCKLIGNVDPYTLGPKNMSSNPQNFGKVTFADLVNCLVFGTSAYTLEDFKAYKSMEPFNQFVCGWVREVFCATIAGKKVFVGKVQHSQRLSEKHLVCWLITEENGIVEAAHCSCMAGLGEACSHVTAILFFVEHSVRTIEEKSVTDVAAYWPVSSMMNVNPRMVKDINFSKPLAKYQKSQEDENCSPIKRPKPVPTPEDEGLKNTILEPYSQIGIPAALFTLMSEHASEGAQRPPASRSRSSLSSLFDPANEHKSLDELQQMALTVDISITEEEAKVIEERTRLQAKSKEWFRQRAGRITASRFKSACVTKIENPSMSLVRGVSYPETVKFKNLATEWGCKHEEVARRQFTSLMTVKHEDLTVKQCGFFVNPDFPHLGASPDGLINCKCCGKGCLEVKCPYCWEVENNDKRSCIVVGDHGKLCLDKNHTYYYQVQAKYLFVKRNIVIL